MSAKACAAVCGLLLSVQSALAEVVASLPLQRGFYVSTSVSCGSASNATLMLVTRTGMNTSRVESTFRKIDRTGPTTYVVTEVPIELGGTRPPPTNWYIRSAECHELPPQERIWHVRFPVLPPERAACAMADQRHPRVDQLIHAIEGA